MSDTPRTDAVLARFEGQEWPTAFTAAAETARTFERENAALREALRKIEAYEPLTFAECSDAEAVIGIARDALDGKQSSQGGGSA